MLTLAGLMSVATSRETVKDETAIRAFTASLTMGQIAVMLADSEAGLASSRKKNRKDAMFTVQKLGLTTNADVRSGYREEMKIRLIGCIKEGSIPMVRPEIVVEEEDEGLVS